MTTISASTMPDHQPSALALLPNELLSVVAEFLTIPELRLLGRTNHRFKAFSDDYLSLFRYKSAFFRLPNEILFKVAEYASTTKHRSLFARVSQKVYPLLMEHLVRYDISNNESRCLLNGARKNNVGMVRKIIALGGHWDMETWCKEDVYWETQRWSKESWELSPLGIAAYQGYNSLARLLLKAGASHYMYDGRTPLDWALAQENEETIGILCVDVCESEIMHNRHALLYTICRTGFVDLTRQVLERGMQHEPHEALVQTRSWTLNILLKGHVLGCLPMPRYLPNLHYIIKLLLEHGANPDLEYDAWRFDSDLVTTSRQLGLKSQDPRVKMLFVRDISDLDHTDELASDPGHLVSLWDFVEVPHEERFFAHVEAPALPSGHFGSSKEQWRMESADTGKQPAELTVTRSTEERTKYQNPMFSSTPTSARKQQLSKQMTPAVGTKAQEALDKASAFWSKLHRN